MVTAFDSSAVTDAILLKKKLLGLNSDFMSKNEIEHAKVIPKRVGYLIFNTRKDYDFNKEELLLKMKKNTLNYENYISKYHCFEPNKNGSQVIIDTIKDRFF